MALIGSQDNKPLPQWPYRLTINTLIAVFSVLIRSASGLIAAQGISHIKWTRSRRPQTLHAFETHDEASQGPWGALVLLGNDLGRSISSLGALVTLSILFLEPFSQQIVSFQDCVRSHGRDVASILRSQYYDATEV